jgi:hypothetical protein
VGFNRTDSTDSSLSTRNSMAAAARPISSIGDRTEESEIGS